MIILKAVQENSGIFSIPPARIEFENIYNKYIRNIIKKRLEMNKNVK